MLEWQNIEDKNASNRSIILDGNPWPLKCKYDAVSFEYNVFLINRISMYALIELGIIKKKDCNPLAHLC